MNRPLFRASALLVGFMLLDCGLTTFAVQRVGDRAEIFPVMVALLGGFGLLGLWAPKIAILGVVVGLNWRLGPAGARNLLILSTVMAVVVAFNVSVLAGVWV